MEPRSIQTESEKEYLTEDLLWGAPKTSDAAFLVSMRSRLNRQPMGVWMSSRRAALAFGLACLLLIGVWYPVNQGGANYLEELESLDDAVIELAYDDTDPTELADYLGVSDDFSIASIENDISFTGVSTSELLELEQQELDLVLSELQETNFF